MAFILPIPVNKESLIYIFLKYFFFLPENKDVHLVLINCIYGTN
ncbi:Uncharacterised protein [uncultured Prevotella sp.]|nr:Uncharacterised protein [uncultured Prevotella sp.]